MEGTCFGKFSYKCDNNYIDIMRKYLKHAVWCIFEGDFSWLIPLENESITLCKHSQYFLLLFEICFTLDHHFTKPGFIRFLSYANLYILIYQFMYTQLSNLKFLLPLKSFSEVVKCIDYTNTQWKLWLSRISYFSEFDITRVDIPCISYDVQPCMLASIYRCDCWMCSYTL